MNMDFIEIFTGKKKLQMPDPGKIDITIKEANDEFVEINKKEGHKPTKNIGARISAYLYYAYMKIGNNEDNEFRFPVVQVIEAAIIHFLTLPTEERIQFLQKNSPEKVKVGDIIPIGLFEEDMRNYLRKRNVREVLIKNLTKEQLIEAVIDIAAEEKGEQSK